MSDIPEYRTGELPDIDPTIGLLVNTSDLSKPTPEDGNQPEEAVQVPSELIEPEEVQWQD